MGRIWKERDNRGTRHETIESAQSYWDARLVLGRHDPFIIYEFRTERAAASALLAVGCIHRAVDSGRLICTEPVDFGTYRGRDGKFVAMICGKGLTGDVFSAAKQSFVRHGGTPRNDGERPPSHGSRSAGRLRMPDTGDHPDVTYQRTDKSAEDFGGDLVELTYHVFKTNSKSAALAFLEHVPVVEAMVYVVVETPDGTIGRDIDGIYVE